MKDEKAIVKPDPDAFTLDVSQPPYQVPCPVCRAFALDACHDRMKLDRSDPDYHPVHRRWPEGAKVLREPHPERWEHWKARPDIRVRPC